MSIGYAQLPKSWCVGQIGELCDLKNGRAFKPSEWTTNGLPIVRIQNLNDASAHFNHFDGEVSDRFLIENGNLLFAWSVHTRNIIRRSHLARREGRP